MAEVETSISSPDQKSPTQRLPQEQLEVQEPGTSDNHVSDDEISYPTGAKLWMAVASLFAAMILHGLDLTIVAVTIPSLTNEFHTLEDIGWYSSAYSVMAASFCFLFGKLYGIFPAKRVYLFTLIVFELGSLLCTVAPTSWMFILGRAVAGVGASGISSGAIIVISRCFPTHKRPVWTTAIGGSQMIGIVSSPVIGGALIDWMSWRACFGINLPLGAAAISLVAFGYKDLATATGTPELGVTWKEKLRTFDILGTLFMVPAVTTLLLALQWGGIRYGWSDPRIIVLFVVSGVLLVGFVWRQHKLQDKATLPPRIFKMRSVLAGAWFNACSNATLAVTEYYIALYFQGVRGFSATRSGLLLMPMLVGITIGGLGSGAGIMKFGYYNRKSRRDHEFNTIVKTIANFVS